MIISLAHDGLPSLVCVAQLIIKLAYCPMVAPRDIRHDLNLIDQLLINSLQLELDHK